jgi:hypothetical protein
LNHHFWMHRIIFMDFQTLQGFTNKQNNLLKKRVGPGLRGRARPAQVRRPTRIWRDRSGTPSSDSDRTAHDPSSSQDDACRRGRRGELGFWRGCAYRGVAGGRRWSDRRQSGLGSDVHPTGVHAEAVALAVVSTSSR